LLLKEMVAVVTPGNGDQGVAQGIAQGLLHKLVTVVTPGIGDKGWSRIAQGNGDIGWSRKW
jgi:hypothetical protein